MKDMENSKQVTALYWLAQFAGLVFQDIPCHAREISEERRRFLKLTFKEFLEHLEMDEETYSTAIRTSIKGQAQLFLQKNPDQVFINNYNKPIMEMHNSNQDLSVVIDEWQVAQYLVSYLTKSEAGC